MERIKEAYPPEKHMIYYGPCFSFRSRITARFPNTMTSESLRCPFIRLLDQVPNGFSPLDLTSPADICSPLTQVCQDPPIGSGSLASPSAHLEYRRCPTNGISYPECPVYRVLLIAQDKGVPVNESGAVYRVKGRGRHLIMTIKKAMERGTPIEGRIGRQKRRARFTEPIKIYPSEPRGW